MDQTKHLAIITAHHPFDKTELSFKQAILAFVQRHDDFYKRTLECGHVTGSAWIINPAHSHALMLHHKKLGHWLQPGGHIEQDSDVLAAALREAREETGIKNMRVVSDAIFDIDIHTIPANCREAEHLHFDIRYLFEISLDTMPVVSDESNDVRWFSLEEIAAINDDTSIQRMILKTIMLRDKAG
ncbi:MAG: NUDIX hydrolase [Gammaproteobacteria bacterium]|nr:NUDIX hydrolase [Gammaproteobacteria bacterium]